MWSNSSSPQKNCNGVGLGEEAFFHLAQPYKQETPRQKLFHVASFCFCDVSLEIQIYKMHLMIKNNWKQAFLLSAKRFLSL